MDFLAFIRTHAAQATATERQAIYNRIRAKVDGMAAAAADDEAFRKAQRLRDELETAVHHFEAERAPEEQHPPAGPSSLQPDGSGRGRLAELLLAAVAGSAVGVASMLLWRQAPAGPGHILPAHFEAARATVDTNLSLLRAIRGGLDELQRAQGAYPVAPAWHPLSAIATAAPGLEALLGRQGGQKDRLLYRGGGGDYKLIMHQSGDCFVVNILHPELVDSTRRAGPVDCYAYGYWTAGAAGW
jgi:hypothetical protein